MTTSNATAIIRSLAREIGYDAVVQALIEEARTAPGEELGSIEVLIDAVMADILSGVDDEQI